MATSFRSNFLRASGHASLHHRPVLRGRVVVSAVGGVAVHRMPQMPRHGPDDTNADDTDADEREDSHCALCEHAWIEVGSELGFAGFADSSTDLSALGCASAGQCS